MDPKLMIVDLISRFTISLFFLVGFLNLIDEWVLPNVIINYLYFK